MNWQTDFLAAIQGNKFRNDVEFWGTFKNLADVIDPMYRRRFYIYQTGHFARITQNLVNSIFSPAAKIVGNSGLENILFSYFSIYPATHPLLVHAADKVPDFVRAEPGFSEIIWLADVLDYCIARWRILNEHDPESTQLSVPVDFNSSLDFSNTFLLQPAAMVKSSFPLYNIIESTLAADDEPPVSAREFDLGLSQGVLICKTSSVTLTTLVIPNELQSFVSILASGENFMDALEAITKGGDTKSSPANQEAVSTSLSKFCEKLLTEKLLGFRQVSKVVP